MHLRRFRAPLAADALALARQALGPDAVVLSTSLVAAAGWRGLFGAREVEVTAATEREVSDGRPARRADRHQAARKAIAAQLRAAGFDGSLADDIAASAAATARRGVPRAALEQAVADAFAPVVANPAEDARIHAFVGPPGAGKTTTIAKIAAQARVAGLAPYTLVAADGFRVGAVEQLRIYADVIGSPFVVARTPSELGAILDRVTGPVLVDTAGRSPRDEASSSLFAALRSVPGMRSHLVVPAAMSARDLSRALDGHAAARPARLVLTKADEVEAGGSLGRVLRDRRVPVSYIGTGQRVPEDLVRATPRMLSALLLGDAVGERLAEA